jgi:hypothetical protein
MRVYLVRIIGFSFALVVCVTSGARAVTSTSGTELRHLVYSFTYGQTGDLTVHNEPGYMNGAEQGAPPRPHMGSTQSSGTTSGAPGMHDYSGTVHDSGTIVVDVMREQPDTGLIVTISEQATGTRKADQATCVTYGTTNVICDPNKTVNSEELTLLRFLGRNFVDPNKIDAKGHWGLGESNPAVATTSDYTLTGTKNGAATIQETRVVKDLGSEPVTTDVSTTIDYDLNRQVPTKVQEYAERRESSTATGSMKTTVQTTLTLVSDSMAKP